MHVMLEHLGSIVDPSRSAMAGRKCRRAPSDSSDKSLKKKTQKKKQGDALLEEGSYIRGKAARLAFIVDVASASSAPVDDVRKFLDAARVVMGRSLVEAVSYTHLTLPTTPYV